MCHSWLEEDYCRWFVFLYLETAVGLHWAVGISSFAFMGHHAVLLGAYFQWAVLPTVFFTACVGAGGAFWALLYHRADSLLSPWLSHMLVDAAIFLIGFDLVRPK